MIKRKSRWSLILCACFFTCISRSFAVDSGAAACIHEIERVCVHLEDKLETCLSDRGSQLSASCRDQLSGALKMMKDPSGPAACIADIQRVCANLEPDAITRCITEQQGQFSDACQKYLQQASSKDTSAL